MLAESSEPDAFAGTLRINCSSANLRGLRVSAEIVRHGSDSRAGSRTIMTVKNFRVSVSLAGSNAANPGIVWALVYVPSSM